MPDQENGRTQTDGPPKGDFYQRLTLAIQEAITPRATIMHGTGACQLIWGPSPEHTITLTVSGPSIFLESHKQGSRPSTVGYWSCRRSYYNRQGTGQRFGWLAIEGLNPELPSIIDDVKAAVMKQIGAAS
jgi:hypothetical protein